MAIADILKSIFGSKTDRDMKAIQPVLDQILKIYPDIDRLSNDELRARSQALKEQIAAVEKPFEDRIAEIKLELEKDIPVSQKETLAGESDKLVKDEDEAIEVVLNQILPEAFAIMKSTARRFAQSESVEVTATDFDRKLAAEARDFVNIDGDKAVWHNHWMAGGNEITWDMVHYDVQLIGGIVLNGGVKTNKEQRGMIAEMATGEGKTLVATLPVFLNALAGKGVHVVTVNDYLAKRDSEWMGPLYMFHGLSVDCIDKHQPNSDSRRRAYNCDITFGTNNEFGFDYLRDNMCARMTDLVQRKHHYAIVDEVDSVLIDDARTPLIISGPMEKASGDEQFMEYRPFVENLYNKQRALINTTLNESKKLIAAGDEAEGGKLLYRCYKGLPKYQPLIKFLSEPGMKALMQKTEAYYMQDNEREMPVVTDELYFVINEVLNSVDMTDKGHDTLASSVSDPNFFVLPDMGSVIAEITNDTSLTPQEKAEKKDALMEDFSLKSERVHTVIQLLKAYAMFTKDVDYVIVEEHDNQGNPIPKVKIVDESTGRIMEGRRWSDGLHQAVEAKENVKVEAATQTFATITLQNYFRMYHKLAGMTGTAETEAGEFWDIYKLDVVVIPTNRPVIRDDQNDVIYKTKKAKFNAVIDKVVELSDAGRPVLVGTTDVETSELLARMMKLRGIKADVLNAKEHAREAEIVAKAGLKGHVTIATNMAGRGTDIKLSPEVKEAGGLAIIGTTRHDSRRVDRQLRGRAGRQGDPGSSCFYISLEDDLMRKFGSERIAGIVDKLGMEENEALESSMLSKAIENAQKKVEENHFGWRKRTLEYDDVMNYQREAVYSRRRNALSGERIEIDVQNMMEDTAILLAQRSEGMSFEEFEEMVIGRLSIDLGFDADFYASAKPREVAAKLAEHMKEVYDRRMNTMIEKVNPVIKTVFEKQGSMYENIAIPITNGKKQLNLSVNLQKAYETESREIAKALSRNIILFYIDDYWKQHLRDMDDLRQSVQNAAYEQKDPLVVYKLESYNLFTEMLEKLNEEVLAFLLRAFIPLRDASDAREARPATQPNRNLKQMHATDPSQLSTNAEQRSRMPVRVDKQVGRNDPCPCGSGLKFKNCHGKGQV
ncbi:MAG: preprotein translocase subunit SecA [Bacteroidales bacterium]|nr:preprotein translocase subunit SecA [Bacteroidales bacterium]